MTQAPKAFKHEELKKFTNNFSEQNHIGPTQLGNVYRGKIGQKAVTVKMWNGSRFFLFYEDERKDKMDDELSFQKYESLRTHPNLVKVLGFCYEGDEHVGIVYDLSPLDTVRNLIPKDSFEWKQRIKVALGLARALESIHMEEVQNPLILRNLDALHVMCDEDYTPKLFDFGMITGGLFLDRTKFRRWPGSLGYVDPFTSMTGHWTTECDVFAYGVILLGLITKRVFNPETDPNKMSSLVFVWAKRKYERQRKTLVSEKISFAADSLKGQTLFYPSDGRKLTKLAMKCVEDECENRPTMSQVLETLFSLRVVKRCPAFMGIEEGEICRVQKVTQKVMPDSTFRKKPGIPLHQLNGWF